MIHRLANFVDVAAGFELVGALDVTSKVVANSIYGTVVAPLVGIADFVADAGQLGQRLLFGFGTHPVESADALAHGVLNAFHHVECALLERRRKHFGHIHLTERFAEVVIDVLHAALPAGLLFFCTA